MQFKKTRYLYRTVMQYLINREYQSMFNNFPLNPPIYPSVHEAKIKEYFQSINVNDSLICDNSNMCEYDLYSSYFICFTNRCGSNFLGAAIASDGRLARAGENLNYDTVINQSKRNELRSFDEYFYWLINKTKRKLKVFGCKTSIGQLMFLYDIGVLAKFKKPPKFIHVIRKDVIAQAVSLSIANQTKKWTSQQEGVAVEVKYLQANIANIVQSFCKENAMFSFIFNVLGVQPLTIYYEDLVDCPEENMCKIGEFIGVEDLKFVPSAIPFQKQSDERNELFKKRFIKHYTDKLHWDNSGAAPNE